MSETTPTISRTWRITRWLAAQVMLFLLGSGFYLWLKYVAPRWPWLHDLVGIVLMVLLLLVGMAGIAWFLYHVRAGMKEAMAEQRRRE